MRTLLPVLLLLPTLTWGSDALDTYLGLETGDGGYDESLEVPWVEIETQVQRGPVEKNLAELEIEGLPPGMTLLADLEGLAVDRRDYVTRLWLVVRSDGGVDNGSYEGFRCATGEYKVYAYYNPQRSKPLRVVRLPRWRTIRPSDYRFDLAKGTLCSDTNPRDPDRIRAYPVRQAGDYRSPYE